MAESMRRRATSTLECIGIAGALFWAPDLAVHAALALLGVKLGQEDAWDSLHRVLAAGLPIGGTYLAYQHLDRRFARTFRPYTLEMLMVLGIWLVGGIFMPVAWSFSGARVFSNHAWFLLLMTFPFSLVSIAGYDGSLLTVVGVCIALFLFERHRRRREAEAVSAAHDHGLADAAPKP